MGFWTRASLGFQIQDVVTYSGRIHALRFNVMRFVLTTLGFSKLEGAPKAPRETDSAKRCPLQRREAPSAGAARSAVRYSRPLRGRRPLLQARSEKAAG